MTDYVGDIGMGNQETAIAVADLLGMTANCKGKRYIYARAGEALTKNTPYGLIHEGGTGATTTLSDPVVKALLSTAVYQTVCIPTFHTMADNDTGWFQIQGPVVGAVLASVDYTAGYALKVDAGVLTMISAAPTNGATEVGHIMARASTGAVALADIFLYGYRVLTET